MKRFLKKRWHRIPVALVSALLVLALTAGGAFAYTIAWPGTVDVTVEEAITVEPRIGLTVNAVWDGDTLIVVGLMPGENFQGSTEIHNASSVDLSVTATMVQTSGATTFLVGDADDIGNCIVGGPVPAYSWIALNVGTFSAGPIGTPVTFIIPAGGMEYLGIGGQAGTDIVPGAYTFTITVER